MIGDYDASAHATAGRGRGAPEIATGCPEVVVIAPHFEADIRRIGLETSRPRTGARDRPTIFTDLGVLEPERDGGAYADDDPHPACTVEQVREATGWDLARRGDAVAVTPNATDEGTGRAAGADRAGADDYLYDGGSAPRSAATAARSRWCTPMTSPRSVVKELLLRATPTSTRRRSATVTFGDADPVIEDNRNVGRMAVLLAGLPTSVPATGRSTVCAAPRLDAASAGEPDVRAAATGQHGARRRRLVKKSRAPRDPAQERTGA